MHNKLDQIFRLLDCTADEMEEMVMRHYFDWCSGKCYTPATNKAIDCHALNLELNTQDLQSLMADRALFNYFLNQYLESMLDFLEDAVCMRPLPTTTEARLMYKNSINNVHRFYNTDLMTTARNKKINEHVKN
ncbi:hypothetical protein [Maribacter sp. ACAM166]|uniref:hypothetical protein n=1 Tax=Maribacter sp. ACAM166 TaxID=2508996 RepID=UPI0010FEE450|nr:hypothetical protein [Maribacter sp. ACAM166]TLP81385.1 hypothetical protein ES765_05090 [Maribacter sp. ACAM166]